jgi:hypothetical protein
VPVLPFAVAPADNGERTVAGWECVAACGRRTGANWRPFACNCKVERGRTGLPWRFLLAGGAALPRRFLLAGGAEAP